MSVKFSLENYTFEEVKKLDKNKTIIMFPIGPLEAHGPHLPLDVDIRGAEITVELASKQLEEYGYSIVSLPVLPYCIADAAHSFEGTISISENTMLNLLRDIITSVVSHGFNNIVIFCHHLEPKNTDVLNIIEKEFNLSKEANVLVSKAIEKSISCNKNILDGEFPLLDMHAGEVETSLFLWKFPNRVKGNYSELTPKWINLIKQFANGANDFETAGANNCYLGDPAKASAEKGRILYEKQAKILTEEVYYFMKSDEAI
ncbi:creatininase family protein [Priestia megaterium]|nr:creatininase family protein [Priestia megaterium]